MPLVLRASRHPRRRHPRWSLLKRAGEPIKLWRARRDYGRADAIVALSQDAATTLRCLLGRRPVPIEVILNPVVPSSALMEPRARQRRDAQASPLVLGVGRFTRQKDFATLLRAFALLRARRPARLVLLGDGPERPRLEALAAKLGIAAEVEMPGEVGNVAEWLGKASLLASSSLWEGMQATLIEGLAAGCPVVATDCPGGARETLQDRRLGPLVPVRDPRRLAQAMAGLIDCPPDPVLLRQGAERFTLEGKAERYLALFDSLQATSGD